MPVVIALILGAICWMLIVLSVFLTVKMLEAIASKKSKNVTISIGSLFSPPPPPWPIRKTNEAVAEMMIASLIKATKEADLGVSSNPPPSKL